MKINDVLVQMEASALGGEFTKSIETLYWEQVRKEHLDETENECGAAKARLMPILSEEKAASLKELETHYAENMAYASRFGFKCGIYYAFRQFFTDNCEIDGGFDSVLGKSLSTMPGRIGSITQSCSGSIWVTAPPLT